MLVGLTGSDTEIVVGCRVIDYRLVSRKNLDMKGAKVPLKADEKNVSEYTSSDLFREENAPETEVK